MTKPKGQTQSKAPAKAQPKDRKAPAKTQEANTGMPESIEIEGGRTAIPVKLVGITYEAVPPKGIVALDFAKTAQKASQDPAKLIASLKKWLSMAFTAEDAKAIEDRLYEPHDDLDIHHIVKLIQKMTEQSTGNPTS